MHIVNTTLAHQNPIKSKRNCIYEWKKKNDAQARLGASEWEREREGDREWDDEESSKTQRRNIGLNSSDNMEMKKGRMSERKKMNENKMGSLSLP